MCRRGRESTRAANLSDGRVGSMQRKQAARLLDAKSLSISFLILLLLACLSAALLSGSRIGLAGLRPFLSSRGRSLAGLVAPSAALFASTSTASLPAICVWPGTRLI